MNRRGVLMAAASLTGAGLLGPQMAMAAPNSGGPTVIVELITFLCPRSRSVNEHIQRLTLEAESVGTILRCAPVAWIGQSLWPDRFYYAMRDLYPHTEHIVREVLFDGLQRDGLKFEELTQVMAYMERRQVFKVVADKIPDFNLVTLADKAGSDDPLFAEYKATRLIDASGATEMPVFMWIVDGEIKKKISPQDAKEPMALVSLVSQAINRAAS